MERSQSAASIMTTATLNGVFNSPDTPSPVYPDRLIRPLPKRPLRSRLSIDAADSILYPLTTPAQIFHGIPTDNGVGYDPRVYVQQTVEHDSQDQNSERDFHYPYENGVDFDSGDEDGPVVVRRSAGFRGSSLSPSSSSHPRGLPGNVEGPRQIKSSSAGPDGYDAFENTNNKKKRKIPTPGNLGSHHSSLSPEFPTMGLAASAPSTPSAVTVADANNHAGTYYGTGNPASPVGSGTSGSGRGRLGRQVTRSGSGKIPLSVQTQIGFANGRLPIRPDGGLSSPGTDFAGKPDQGIISAAIANAATVPSPPRGPGNVSLLDQQAPATTPTKTQFTFTCESDSSKGMALQAQNTYPAQQRSPTSPLAAMPRNPRAFSTQGTQTSPSMAAQMNQQGYSQQLPLPQMQQQQHHEASGGEPPNRGRKKKRSPGSIYALAARQRKIEQQYANLHHPPNMEDLWICEFCEYENIFGRPPEALIRQYEIKDRKERKRVAEKKRLLEKAKMKGRKNKKGTKNPKNTGSNGAHQPGYDRASIDQSSAGGSGGGHDDDYNEYDEEPAPVPGPPSASFKPPLPPGNQPKMTVTPSIGIDVETNRPP